MIKQYFLDYLLAFFVSFIAWAVVITLFAGIIGLCGSFLHWDMSYFYSVINELYGTPKSIREGILIIGLLSFILSFFAAGIMGENRG